MPLSPLSDKRFLSLCLSICVLLSACDTALIDPSLQVSSKSRSQPVRQTSAKVTKIPSVHLVKKGDTLDGIAKKYEIRRQDLADWNQIEAPNYVIRLGQKLRLQAPEPFQKVERPSSQPTEKTVVKDLPVTTTVTDNNSPLLEIKPQQGTHDLHDADSLNEDTDVADNSQPSDGRDFIAYKPPVKGVTERVPVQSRGQNCLGLSAQDLNLQLWTPAQITWTHQSQPQLFWSIDQDIDVSVSALITEINADLLQAPILEKRSQQQLKAGVYVVDLKAENVHLQANKVYQWSVSLICDPSQRSQDVFASAEIQYMPLTEAAPDTGLAQAYFYAEQGYWYDALQSLLHLSGEQARQALAVLLEQGRVRIKAWHLN